MLYREFEVEKFWDLPSTSKDKKKRIETAIVSDRYGATIKKDGEYIRAIYDTDGEIWVIGRGTNAKEVHNLKDHLTFITNWLKTNFKPGTCILGELYVPGETSRAIRKYTGSLVKKSLAEQAKCPPTFYIFDVWALNGRNLMDETYENRMWILGCTDFTEYPHPQITYAKMIRGTDKIFDFIGEAFENGEEGVVLVDLNSKVTPGKRTAWKTIKVKKEFQNGIDCFFTGNFTIATREYTGKEIENWIYWENIKTGERKTGEFYKEYLNGAPIEPITKNYFLNYPGSLEVGVFKNDEIVPICFISGLTDELKQIFRDYPELIIMRPIQITGMETTDNSIRHPKYVGFRDDIPLTDCIYSKIFGESNG